MAISNSIVLEDNSYGTLASGLAVSDVSLSFTTGHGARFPSVAAGQVLYCCLLNSNNVLEEIKITAHTAAADTATIVRGVNGTTAKAWSAGDRIEARLSSEALTHLQQEALKGVTLTTGDSGATYTGSMTATHLGYVNGMIYCFLAATTNSGAGPTINIDSLGAKAVLRDNGDALVAGDMPVNGLYRYNDTNFLLLNRAQGFVPVGTILDYGGTSAPTGFLACDGSAVSRTTYAALFTAISTTWGVGDGSTTFNVPDLRRRTSVGSGGSGTATLAATVGSTGGEETHTLTSDEMPSHTHTDSGHTHAENVNGQLPAYNGSASNSSSVADSGVGVVSDGRTTTDSGTASLSNTGGGSAHNVMQPSAVVLKIIKT